MSDKKPAGRPKSAVKPEDVQEILNALDRSFRNSRAYNLLNESVSSVDAETEIPKLYELQGSSMESRPLDTVAAELNAWKDKFLSEKGWNRIRANIRQSRHRKGMNTVKGQQREPYRNVQIKTKASYSLRIFAERHGVTINDAIEKLLDLAELTQDSTVRKCPVCSASVEFEHHHN